MDLYTQFTKVIDEFSRYDNTLLFGVGNELLTDPKCKTHLALPPYDWEQILKIICRCQHFYCLLSESSSARCEAVSKEARLSTDPADLLRG